MANAWVMFWAARQIFRATWPPRREAGSSPFVTEADVLHAFEFGALAESLAAHRRSCSRKPQPPIAPAAIPTAPFPDPAAFMLHADESGRVLVLLQHDASPQSTCTLTCAGDSGSGSAASSPTGSKIELARCTRTAIFSIPRSLTAAVAAASEPSVVPLLCCRGTIRPARGASVTCGIPVSSGKSRLVRGAIVRRASGQRCRQRCRQWPSVAVSGRQWPSVVAVREAGIRQAAAAAAPASLSSR